MRPTNPDNPPPRPAAPARRPLAPTIEILTARADKRGLHGVVQDALDEARRRQGKPPVAIGPKLPAQGQEPPARRTGRWVELDEEVERRQGEPARRRDVDGEAAEVGEWEFEQMSRAA